MEITDWAKTDTFVNNFITQSLVGKLNPPGTLLMLDDLNAAKEVLRRKVLVGIMEDKSESVQRFKRYLGWDQPGGSLAAPCSSLNGDGGANADGGGGGGGAAAAAALSAKGQEECRSKLLH